MGFNVGDRVRVVYAPAVREIVGEECTITHGPGDFGYGQGSYMIDILDPRGGFHSGPPYCFKKIDDDEKASWEKVEEITGWNPTVVLV